MEKLPKETIVLVEGYVRMLSRTIVISTGGTSFRDGHSDGLSFKERRLSIFGWNIDATPSRTSYSYTLFPRLPISQPGQSRRRPDQ